MDDIWDFFDPSKVAAPYIEGDRIYFHALLGDFTDLVLDEAGLYPDSVVTGRTAEFLPVPDERGLTRRMADIELSGPDLFSAMYGRDCAVILSFPDMIARFIPDGLGWVGVRREAWGPASVIRVLDMSHAFFLELGSVDEAARDSICESLGIPTGPVPLRNG